MLFRWFHENVRHKPYRPLAEIVSQGFWFVVGIAGALLRFLWQVIRRPPPLPVLAPQTLHRIVVIRPDRIGDAVLATPALRALRKAAPQAGITVVASTTTAPLMRLLSSVDEVVTVAGDRFIDWWRNRENLRHLKQLRPDLVVVLQPAWPAAWLAWWLGGVHRAGFDLWGMGWLLTEAVPYPFLKRKAHQVEVNLHLLNAIGIAVPKTQEAALEVPVTEQAHKQASAWLFAHGVADDARIAVMHPGSRSRYTQWLPEHFAAVADRLALRGYQVVILCGPGERPIVERMLSAINAHPIVAGDLPIESVIGLLKRAELFVGNATGTMHLASAVSKRVVAVIGGTHPQDCPERWGPWGAQHRVVHKTPQQTVGYPTDSWVGPEGLQFITPEDVMAAIP